jgi:hypothetical protein
LGWLVVGDCPDELGYRVVQVFGLVASDEVPAVGQ